MGFVYVIVVLFLHSFVIADYSFEKLTIMTCPIGCNASGNYGGHYAVTRSLIEGLKKTDACFNYDPKNVAEVGDVVLVLSDTNALRQAIQFKRNGRIKKLLAGPNLVVWARDDGYILASSEIDICIVPSNHPRVSYIEDVPELESKIRIWYAGVDSDTWKPAREKYDGKNVLVYWKTEGEDFCISVENILRKCGWNPIRLKFGSYNHKQYKELLTQCRFAVFLSRSESQGIALAEAWSMDVPTFPWNPKERTYRGRVYSVVSACSYLTDATGLDWKEFSELKDILSSVSSNLPNFSPRDWVLKNMTDEVSARLMLQIIEDAL